MDSWVIAMMLGGSIFLGLAALFAFLWAIKNGQFDDEEKFLNAAKYDGVDELNDAANQERKKKELQKKRTMPE
ncbi:MAG: cbb3-type cytochrome oxidase assembly protein CcoS [Sulfurimonadaceae bacterium]|nr:cbb3-type cytochrome oxidase assembly protein CcoS [Sulfurimonadaceae bacterium]